MLRNNEVHCIRRTYHLQFLTDLPIYCHFLQLHMGRKCADRAYIWHSAGSQGWPLPMLKYKNIFQIKYTEAILSNSTRKLLWFEITEMLIAVKNQNLLCYLLYFSAHVRSILLGRL